MRRRTWVAVVLGSVIGAGAIEACVSPTAGAPGGEDAGGLGPEQDASEPSNDAGGDATISLDGSGPGDSGIADTTAPQPDVAQSDAGADVAQDTSVADSSEPDASDASDATAPDAADASVATDAGPVFTHYVFFAGAAEVESFGIDLSTGALTPINQSSVDGGSTHQSTSGGSIATALTPNAHYLYAADDGYGVGAYQVLHGGLLERIDANPADAAAVQDFPAGTGDRWVAVTSSFVFTANEVGNSISRFSIGAGGALTSLGDVPLPAGGQPKAVAIDPTGTFLFGFNYLLGTITVFKIDGAGGLTPVVQNDGGPQDFTAPGNPFVGVVHPTLRTLYVTGGSQSNVIMPPAYSAEGVLSVTGQVTGAGVDGGAAPDSFGLALNPAGTFLYVVNYEISLINIYAVDGTTGALTPAGTAPSSTELRAISVDPSGSFLYVAGDSGEITTYGINSGTGALTQLGTVPSPQGGYTDPIGIVP